jgi:hypothetical protein
MDATGANILKLAPYPVGPSDPSRGLACSPYGKWVYFASFDSGATQVILQRVSIYGGSSNTARVMQNWLTHDEREREVIARVEGQFPNFAGNTRPWRKIPDGQDPPDFISDNPGARIGLELREWLDGTQMGNAKMWESIATRFNKVLSEGWERQYQPQHCNWVVLELRESKKLEDADEQAFQAEFFNCVARIDTVNAAPFAAKDSFFRMQDLSKYPTLRKYLLYLVFVGGKPLGSRWFVAQRSLGVFDPNSARLALENAIDDKMRDHATVRKKIN